MSSLSHCTATLPVHDTLSCNADLTIKSTAPLVWVCHFMWIGRIPHWLMVDPLFDQHEASLPNDAALPTRVYFMIKRGMAGCYTCTPCPALSSTCMPHAFAATPWCSPRDSSRCILPSPKVSSRVVPAGLSPFLQFMGLKDHLLGWAAQLGPEDWEQAAYPHNLLATEPRATMRFVRHGTACKPSMTHEVDPTTRFLCCAVLRGARGGPQSRNTRGQRGEIPHVVPRRRAP